MQTQAGKTAAKTSETPRLQERPEAESTDPKGLRDAADRAQRDIDALEKQIESHRAKEPSRLSAGTSYEEKHAKWQQKMDELQDQLPPLRELVLKWRAKADRLEEEQRQAEERRVIAEGGIPEDAEGNWQFHKVTPEHTYRFLTERQGYASDDVIATADANIDAKEPKKPKLGANAKANAEKLRDYNRRLEDYNRNREYWQQVREIAVRDKAEAEKAAEAARAEEIRRQEEERRRAEEEAARRAVEKGVGPEITDRWNNAEKTQGIEDAIITPSGRTIRGRYVLVEEGAATPSHDPETGFAKSAGFPVDKNGNTVNDRDYERDKAAQEYVHRVAAGYDGRAVQDPVIVSRDGVVLSGNNRTMSGRIAARDNTDAGYIGHLEATAAKYGFTAEQVRSMKHPRLYFETEENLPYTAETFALFNKTEKKEMNVTERSVKLGKTISEGVFNRMAREMDAYETFAEYARSPEAVQAIKDLHAAGVIETAELPRYYDEQSGAITPEGVSLLQGALIGHVFSENPDVVRMAMEHPAVRDSILKALVMLAENSRFSPEYSLIGDISRAIEIYHKGKEAGFKIVSESVLQHSLLEEPDIPETTALVIADLLNGGKTTRLQKFLKEYNADARLADAGQLDIFSENAEPKPAEEILRQVYETLGINPKQYERYEKLRNNGKPDEPDNEPNGPKGPGGNPPGPNGPKGGKPEGGGEPPQTPARPAGGAPQPGGGTEPSDAQKSAGNYRKEHRSIDGYRISIENPKGSVRRGTDENGKPWENTMRNDYGYIRGTTGADGDHIDVFLSDSPERGDVFVIDQVKEDGSFDEHKVMYGFASEQEARQAYLSNYAPGWNGLGDITRVSKGEFKKWINSSRRKGKPFAEYKNVKTLAEEADQRKTDVNSEGPETAPGKPEASEPEQGYGNSPLPNFMQAVRALYQKGKKAAAQLFQMSFFDVTKTPEFMKVLGLKGEKFTIRFGVISRHFGKDSDHKLPEDIWEQLPEALQRPFAISKHFEEKNGEKKQKGYRIYTTLKHNDRYVIVGAEVKNIGRNLEINAIETAFAIKKPSESEDFIYTSETITPEQQSLLNGRNSRQYPVAQGLSADKGTTNSGSGQTISGNSAETAPDIRFRDGETPLSKAEPAAPERNLVAVHNLTEENLADALGLGGFPMPSVAVTKAGMEHKDYGGISLVFARESIDPARRGNKVYTGDAWTPVFPETGYKLDGKKTGDIYGRANRAGTLPLFNPVGFHPSNYERRIDRRGDRSLIESFRDSYSAKQLFLSEKGNPVTEMVQTRVEKYTPGRITLLEDIVKTVGEERLLSESDDVLAPEVRGLIEKHDPAALEGKKPFTVKARINNAILEAIDYAENGNIAVKTDTDATKAEIDRRVNQKEFEAWLSDMFSGVVEKKGIRNERDEFTPSGSRRPWESLYDEITLDNVVRAMRRQADKGGQGLLGSSIFGAATRELRDIDDVRREAAARISSVPREEYEAEKEQIVGRLSKVTLPSVAGDFSRAMDFGENVNEAVAKSHTADGIYRHLKGIYPDMTRPVAEEIAGIVADIRKMATRYLEAKPRRAVGFGEVRLAVVPEGTAPELVRQLESRGIPVRTYEPGNERQRADIISRETADRGLRFRNGENDVKAGSEYIHGTAVSGFHKLGEESKTVIKDYLSGHKSSPLRVISDEKDISDLNFSKEDMEEFKTILENEDIPGFYIKGENIIIIFADRLTSASGHETLLHENVHAVADTFGDKERRHLKVFQESMLKNHRRKKSFARLLKEIKDSYPEGEVEEEFLAYSIGRGVHEKDWIPSLMKCLPEETARFIQEKIINEIYGNPDKTFRMDSDRNGTPQNTGYTESTGTRAGGRRLAKESETRAAGSGVNGLSAHSSRRDSGTVPTPREARAAVPVLDLAVRDTRARLDAAGDPQERRELQEQLDQLLEEQDAYATGRAPQTPEQRAGVRRAAETTAAALGEKVIIHSTAAGITHPDAAVRARMRRAKGWYDAATGEVHINAFNHATEADVARTMLHESIGHKALRDFYGGGFDRFLDEIYSSAEEPIRRQIASRMGSNGWDVREATEEYMATLAETVDRHGAEHLDTAARRTWQRAKTAVKRTINRILEKAGLTARVGLTDRDLSYLLWRQYRSRRKAGALEAAENHVRLEALKADPESFAPEQTYGHEKTPVAGQPNRANEKLTSGSILLSAKGDSSSNANVPSEVSAKVANNTQSAKNNIRKFINGDAKMDLSSVNNAFKSIGSLFSMRSNGGSRYTILRADNGDTIALRLSDHAANGRNFGRDNADRNVSIVIERRKFNTPESDIAFTEVTIPVETFNRRPSETVRAIVEGVDGLLRGEEFSLDPSLGTVEKKGNASDSTYRFRDGDREASADPATAEETRSRRIFDLMVDMCNRNKDNVEYRDAARKTLTGRLATVARGMRLQRDFDRAQLAAVTDTCNKMIGLEILDTESRADLARTIKAIGGSAGKEDLEDTAYRLLGIASHSQVRMARRRLDDLSKIRGTKTGDDRIQRQAGLDPEGQATAKAFRDFRKLPEQNIQTAMARVSERIAGDDVPESASMLAAAEMLGLRQALLHSQEDALHRDNINNIKGAVEDLKRTYDRTLSGEERRRYRQARKSLGQQRIAEELRHADALGAIADSMGDTLQASKERVRIFREAEKERVNTIHHDANCDMQGRPAHADKPARSKLVNNTATSFFLAPTMTFDQMLRMFGKHSANGEGYLYYRFMSGPQGWQACEDRRFKSKQAKERILDRKAAEILGKDKAHWADLYKLTRAEGCTLTYNSAGVEVERKVSQGNLMYIYMANKMTDGAVKLRHMNITEEDMDLVEEVLDPRLRQLADWIQDEFLPSTRDQYNEVHMRMFGAPMDYVENYFPLKITEGEIQKNVEIGEMMNDGEGDTPKILTGAIRKRVFNTRALNVLDSDPVSITLEHLEEMEKFLWLFGNCFVILREEECRWDTLGIFNVRTLFFSTFVESRVVCSC